jgi:hypothetical protein
MHRQETSLPSHQFLVAARGLPPSCFDSSVRDIPVEVRLATKEGLSQVSVANLDSVHVVALGDLASRIGTLPASRTPEVKRALGYALDWLELKYGDDTSVT